MTTELLDSIVSSNSQELPNASSALKLFENPQFRVRVIMRCSEPWFVAKDACDCLELTNVSKACQTLDEDEKGITKVYTLGGSQDMMLISESGLYTLIMRSNKPDAKVFRKWVTSEVLPSIRKTGGYGIRTVDDMINDPDTAIRLLTQLKILRLQNKQLEMERDEAIRTKAMIGSRREATATASVKSRECAKLTTENAELKDAVGRGSNWRTVWMMRAEWTREFGHAPDWHKLKQFSEDVGIRPIRDVEEKVILHDGSVKTNTVFRYHREAWEKYREYEENLRVSDKNVRDAKILDFRAADTEIEYFEWTKFVSTKEQASSLRALSRG